MDLRLAATRANSTTRASRAAGRNAILGVLASSDRLRSAQAWHVAVFDNVRGAFGCRALARMDQGLDEFLPSAGADLLVDRRTAHVSHIDGVDQHARLHFQSGALAGGPSAPG
eukprot:7312871-Pyramimonas_sp.AAC.1